MAARRHFGRRFSGDAATVFDAVVRAVPLAGGLRVVSTDPTIGLVTATTTTAWGRNIRIHVQEDAPGSVSVDIRAALKYGIADLGSNQRILDRIFASIERELGQAGG